MSILHVFPNEKFTKDFVTRLYSLFDPNEHVFFINKNDAAIISKEDLPFEQIFWGEIDQDSEKFTELFKKADRVVLHGLFMELSELKVLVPLITASDRKTFWCIWGGDLYNDYETNHNTLNPKKLYKEQLRKKLIGSLYGIIATEDYPEAVKMYKTKARQFPATYSYRLIEAKECEKKDDLVNIMVGHSATDTCRHLETFEKLVPYCGKIRIYCPLSYPNDQAYIELVSNRGKELFGENFYPMTDFMPYDAYVEFLNSIDIGIFNNNRQQGNGNVTNLLYLGKKIYIAPENNLLAVYQKLGAVMFTIDQMDAPDFLEPFSKDICEKNRNVVINRYSDEAFYTGWNKVFVG